MSKHFALVITHNSFFTAETRIARSSAEFAESRGVCGRTQRFPALLSSAFSAPLRRDMGSHHTRTHGPHTRFVGRLLIHKDVGVSPGGKTFGTRNPRKNAKTGKGDMRSHFAAFVSFRGFRVPWVFPMDLGYTQVQPSAPGAVWQMQSKSPCLCMGQSRVLMRHAHPCAGEFAARET